MEYRQSADTGLVGDGEIEERAGRVQAGGWSRVEPTWERQREYFKAGRNLTVMIEERFSVYIVA